jgi:ABC-type uncharacterized transport system permease subunit
MTFSGTRLREALASLASGGGYAAGALLLSAAVAAAVVLLLGGHPLKALAAIHAGSVATPASLTETLVKATPLAFTGLGIAVAFRCGVWNIGAEGQLLVGMLAAAFMALALPGIHPAVAVPVCLCAGAVAGMLWAALPALLRLRRDVPEVISTIMLNFLAVYLIQYLVRGPLKDPRSASDWSPLLPAGSHLPRLAVPGAGDGASLRLPDGTPVLALGVDAGRLHAGVLLALLVGVLLWLWLARSRTGFQIRAVGLNAEAARAAGMPVARVTTIAFLLSGALAGLGGAVEILGLVHRLYRYEPGSPGYGFSGIAVALLGQLHPAGVLTAALFFGGLTAGCNQMQRVAGVSFQVAYVIQAVVVLLLITLPRGRRFRVHRAEPPGYEGGKPPEIPAPPAGVASVPPAKAQ